MFDMGFWELLIIAVVALLVLGPDRMPGAVRSVAKTIGNVRNMAQGFRSEIEEQLRIHELHENLKKAEQQGMQNLSPEVQQSIDELKSAAKSVQAPFKK
jgi:sec-independent protein translocase protein TatB